MNIALLSPAHACLAAFVRHRQVLLGPLLLLAAQLRRWLPRAVPAWLTQLTALCELLDVLERLAEGGFATAAQDAESPPVTESRRVAPRTARTRLAAPARPRPVRAAPRDDQSALRGGTRVHVLAEGWPRPASFGGPASFCVSALASAPREKETLWGAHLRTRLLLLFQYKF